MRRCKLFIILLIFFFSISSICSADKIYLKNGSVIEGIILEQNDENIILQIISGTITFNRNKVEKIEEANQEENNELRRHWQALKKQQKESAVSEEEIVSEETSGVYTKGRRIYLNDKLFYIKGVSYDISYPKLPVGMWGYDFIPQEVFEKDFKMMKKAGINCIRTYEPLPSEILDLAEKYNIMVIEQIVYPGDWTDYTSPYQLEMLKEQAVRVVKRDKDRPNILMWSIWNDAPFTWGSCGGNVVKRYGFETVNNFLREIYEVVKAEDKNHPVTGSNCLDQVGTELGFDFLDVIGVNAYIGGHDAWQGRIKAKQTADKLVQISKEHNKPVVILETGCSTYTIVNEELQYMILGSQIEIVNQHIAGIVIFQWTDGWWKAGQPLIHNDDIEEHWGILTGYRKPKPGYRAVSEMFNSIPTESMGYSPY